MIIIIIIIITVIIMIIIIIKWPAKCLLKTKIKTES